MLSDTWPSFNGKGHLLDHGVALHASRSIHLSTAHTRQDLDAIIVAMIGASEGCSADGLFKSAS